ncbi:MAG: hypothetical protein KatS3mg031_1488 [Chitinophagales bacterium]|nr:MAG: hypothetical protein KatS3mg031_1488 [Chitinophagales bacterium]
MQTPKVEIYTEATPNPESLKFVANRIFLKNHSIDCRNITEAKEVPLARELFNTYVYVNGVFIAANFVTLTKKAGYDWNEIIPEIRDFLKNYLSNNLPVVSENFQPPVSHSVETGKEQDIKEQEIEKRIKELLEQYVKPAVEMDGGAIQFKSFKDGRLTLMLQGACSGCPSSMITLKAGIEGMMKRMVPEVVEVIAEEA